MKFILHLAAASLCLILISKKISAQGENNNWYFGDSCAVSFNTGSPVNLPNGSLSTNEGCSSISDSAGNLLFYTDGVTVYNSAHEMMPNGDSLFGHFSSTQSALIVKKPASDSLYYIFTTGSWNIGVQQLCYSIVDISLDGGLGDVAVKNILLIAPADEKLTSIANEDSSECWILVHQQPNHYYAYRVSSTGIDTPVISTVGIINTASAPQIGGLKISPDKIHIASCLSFMHRVEIATFNEFNGTVSNPFTFYDSSVNATYGLEFSPSGKFLYLSSTFFSPPYKIYQIDLWAGDSSAVLSSAHTIHTGNAEIDALQLAPDGKIYVAHYNNNFLGVINNPDSSGIACNYVDTGFTLNATSKFGLPNAIVVGVNYIPPQATIQPLTTKICPDSCISFGNQSTNATSYEWFFQGGNPNYSTDEFPNVCYNTSGFYDVTLIAHNGPYSDTTTSSNLIEVYAPPTPTITQSNDTLYATNVQTGSTYQWLLNGNVISGSTNSFYIPIVNGTYEVVVTNEDGCSGSDDLVVTTIGIDEITESAFQLFPNPADESVTVSLSNHQQATIKLYNTLGQIIFSDSIVKTITIDVSKLAAGVYYISIQNENDLVTKKLVISHH